jgi:hypothetical protein
VISAKLRIKTPFFCALQPSSSGPRTTKALCPECCEYCRQAEEADMRDGWASASAVRPGLNILATGASLTNQRPEVSFGGGGRRGHGGRRRGRAVIASLLNHAWAWHCHRLACFVPPEPAWLMTPASGVASIPPPTSGSGGSCASACKTDVDRRRVPCRGHHGAAVFCGIHCSQVRAVVVCCCWHQRKRSHLAGLSSVRGANSHLLPLFWRKDAEVGDDLHGAGRVPGRTVPNLMRPISGLLIRRMELFSGASGRPEGSAIF